MNQRPTYSLIIPDEDKEIKVAYDALYKALSSSNQVHILDRVHDLLYAFGGVKYFHEENLKVFKKIRQGMERHIKNVVVKEVLSKDPEGSYLSFPTGETTNFTFIYVFDAFIFSAKRTLDFLAKIPASCFSPNYLSKDEIKHLSMDDFIKAIRSGSKKYKSLSIEIRKKMPELVKELEQSSDWIKYLTDKRDGLMHRFAYKQLFFRATVEIKNSHDWNIIAWECSTNPKLKKLANSITSIDDSGVVQDRDNAEAIVKDCTPRLKRLVISSLDKIYKYQTKDVK